MTVAGALFIFEQLAVKKMTIPRTDIERNLRRERSRASDTHTLAEWLRHLNIDAGALEAASSSRSEVGRFNGLDLERLEEDRIYHLSHIKQVCITYRLRFLDLSYFKPALPEEAVEAMRTLESAHETQLQNLKILAPSRLFKLEDKDDPLLFVPLGDDYFYLVHKWGNDLHPLRRWLVWPFRNIGNLTLLVLLISYLVTLLVPNGLFTKNGGNAEFWIIFFFMFKSIAAVVIFYGFALGKNFNPAIWDSKYFNA